MPWEIIFLPALFCLFLGVKSGLQADTKKTDIR
jgi:hypothetical protein